VEQESRLLELTADIVAAHVANNNVAVGDVAGLVQRVHQALAGLGTADEKPEAEAKPAVSVRSSVKPDHLVCLVCGSRQKTLRRHIGVAHAMAPQDYRSRFNLPASYPMVAPDYTNRRREIAHALGLGRNRKGRGKAAASAPQAGGGTGATGGGTGATGGGTGGTGGGGEAPKPRRGRRKS
jgi:predicted transcriptional regulator